MRRVRTEAGEIGIIYKDEQYIFRPSLKNIQNIGTPTEIIDIMLDLVGHNFKPELVRIGRFYMHQETKRMFTSAMRVIESCGKVPQGLFGWYKGSKYQPGKVPLEKAIIIAIGLIQAGTVGKPKPRAGDKKQGSKEFNATDMIMTCATKLSISVSDAENMTMIEMQRAIDIAFPDDKSSLTNKETYDEAVKKRDEMLKRTTFKIKVA